MSKKFYTIDDLYNFCKENRFESFSAEKHGAPLVVQSIGTFEANGSSDGLLAVKLKSCHTGKNRNKSGISDDNMNKYKDTFKGRPILGAIYKTDTGEYEFRSHDMEIVQDGEETEINYIESPIGVISQTTDPYLEFDEDADKNYLMVEGTIFADYSKAAEILERRRTCKCSVEIAVEEFSYQADEDYLSIDKFRFAGVTILGYQQDGVTEIQEGMEGSKITIDNFSEKKNSMFSAECQNKLIEVLEKLDMTLSSFNKKDLKEGGDEEMDNFENEVVEEVVETAAEETVVETVEETETQVVVEEETEVEETEIEEPSTSEDGDVEVVNEKCELKYEISHEDVRNALYNLLRANSDDEYYYAWIVEVYDDKFIYEDSNDWKYYRQKYAKDGDNVSFDGERVEVFSEWLSQEEKDALDTLKADYAELKSFKEKYDASELKAQKDAIFAKAEYAILVDDDAFKTLVNEAEKFSVEEVEAKVKSIFADHVIKTGTFSAKPAEENKPNTIGLNFNAKPSKKKSAYGGLFEKDE